MFAISFDMVISDLKKYYGDPYHGAYWEIKNELSKCGFYWIQGSTYMTNADDFTTLFAAIDSLRRFDWFKKSVRDIRGYKVENWSDFTGLIKNS